MRRCIIGVTTLTAVLALMVSSAGAHTTYKGHTCSAHWFVSTPGGGRIEYRECKTWMYGTSPHYHDYVTQWFDDLPAPIGWHNVHFHYGRLASPHTT